MYRTNEKFTIAWIAISWSRKNRRRVM